MSGTIERLNSTRASVDEILAVRLLDNGLELLPGMIWEFCLDLLEEAVLMIGDEFDEAPFHEGPLLPEAALLGEPAPRTPRKGQPGGRWLDRSAPGGPEICVKRIACGGVAGARRANNQVNVVLMHSYSDLSGEGDRH
ncbi:MAG: hypothetical protein OXK82_05610 [Deltaproteobacteria bacterium]|nr:hypothetical protein [Deltaproteobacteria bacterium]